MSALSLKLLQPTTIGSTPIKNRIALAALTRARAGEDENANKPWIIEYYKQRASAGIIITEATSISAQGRGWAQAASIQSDDHAQGWKAVTDAVHQVGQTAIFAQLWHMGRASHSTYGLHPVAPSAIAAVGTTHGADFQKYPYEVPRELTIEEIRSTIQDYKSAAKRAVDAGFDGVEVHAANGYLIDEFLQSTSNKRDDIYGGSFENRFRFLKEVLEAILEILPAEKIGVKLSPNGIYNDMGSEDNYEAYSYFIAEVRMML